MRTHGEKALIKQLLQSPQWPLVEQIAKELVLRIKDASYLKDSQWETAKSVAVAEGQIQGLSMLIQELYNQLQD